MERVETPGTKRERAFMEAKATGNERLKGKQYAAAVQAYSVALGVTDGMVGVEWLQRRAQCLSNRSFARVRLGETRAALSDATAAVQAAPLWPKAYFRLGESYRHAGQYQNALAAYGEGAERCGAEDDTFRAELTQYARDAARLATLQAVPPPPVAARAALGAAIGVVVLICLLCLAGTSGLERVFGVLAGGALGALAGAGVALFKRFEREAQLTPPTYGEDGAVENRRATALELVNEALTGARAGQRARSRRPERDGAEEGAEEAHKRRVPRSGMARFRQGKK